LPDALGGSDRELVVADLELEEHPFVPSSRAEVPAGAAAVREGHAVERALVLDLAIRWSVFVLLVVQGLLINRLAGMPYPVWSPRPAEN
jgi:hypothetical protein